MARREIPVETLAAQITVRIKHKFRQRKLEWMAASQITAFGFVLMHQGDSLNSPGLAYFASLANESTWAIVLFIIGISRLFGLIVNGAMEYVTPWIRTVGALAGLYVFGLINTSLLYSVIALGNPASLGLAMCGCAFFGEIAAIVYAIMDARTYENGRRERRRSSESST